MASGKNTGRERSRARHDGRNEPSEGSRMEDEAADEVDVSAPELLGTLARLDAEAAHAYAAAAEVVEDDETRSQLERFAEDHLRHVEDIGRMLAAMGEEAAGVPTDPGTMLLPALVRMAAPLGMPSVLLALLNDEQVTSASYDDAVGYAWDDDAERVLERCRADEERHLRWLSEQYAELERMLGAADDSTGAPV